MTEAILKVAELRKSFSGVAAVDGMSLEISANEIHAVIGPNGAGKTTLVSLLDGAIAPDGGRVEFRGRRIEHLPAHRRAQLGLTRSFQITSIFPEMTVLENVALAVQARSGPSYWRLWRPAMADRALVEPALRYLEQVGLAGQSDRRAGAMSHGEHRQLEIAMALATEPALLLLDEPMAGMGSDESARMLELIARLRLDHSVLLIEHDMDAVFALADRITVMVYGRAIRTGTPDQIRNDPEVRRAYLGDEECADA